MPNAVHDTCPTCLRNASSPHRRYDVSGRVTEGCIDAFHTGQLTPLTESARWHGRPAAAAHRKAVALHLRTL
jgi:hypothetical protein